MPTISSLALRKRDTLFFERLNGLYTHCAVYIGNGNVIHFNVDPNKSLYDNIKGYLLGQTEIRIDPLVDVAGSSNVYFIGDPLPVTYDERELRINLALERVGERSYSLPFHNCHHLCQEITGIEEIPSDKYLIKRVILENEYGDFNINVSQNATCTTVSKINGADFTTSQNVERHESRDKESNTETCILIKSDEFPSYMILTHSTNNTLLVQYLDRNNTCFLSSFILDTNLMNQLYFAGRDVDTTHSICNYRHTQTLEGSDMCLLRNVTSTSGIDNLLTLVFTTHTEALGGHDMCLLRNADIDYTLTPKWTNESRYITWETNNTCSLPNSRNGQLFPGQDVDTTESPYITPLESSFETNNTFSSPNPWEIQYCPGQDVDTTESLYITPLEPPFETNNTCSSPNPWSIQYCPGQDVDTLSISPSNSNVYNGERLVKEQNLFYFAFVSEVEEEEVLHLVLASLMLMFICVCKIQVNEKKLTFNIAVMTCVLTFILVHLTVFLHNHIATIQHFSDPGRHM